MTGTRRRVEVKEGDVGDLSLTTVVWVILVEKGMEDGDLGVGCKPREQLLRGRVRGPDLYVTRFLPGRFWYTQP